MVTSPHGVDAHEVSTRQTQQSSVEANIEDVIAKADTFTRAP